MEQKQPANEPIKGIRRRQVQRKKTFLAALEQAGGHIANACLATRIARSTIYEWMGEDKVFEAGVDHIRDNKIDNVEAALYKSALEGNTIAQIFFLKTIGKKRGYVERHEVVDVTEVDFTDA